MRSLDNLEQKFETPGGHALWKLYIIIVSLIMTAFLGMILGKVSEGHDAYIDNFAQGREISILQEQTKNIIEEQKVASEQGAKTAILLTQLQDQMQAMQLVQVRLVKELNDK